jgi:polysaccharide biosynthesis/export protein
MQISRYKVLLAGLFWLSLPISFEARSNQSLPAQGDVAAVGSSVRPRSDYVLGPDDEITISALNADEISNKPMRIDGTGNINIPMLGRVHVVGLNVRELEAEISAKLSLYIVSPDVTVYITAYRSQPVSILGSVRNPGTHQLEGRKTLIEVLSLAGGLNPEAGNVLKITRRAEWGKIPLPDATMDKLGECSVAEIGLKSLMEARKPEENIVIMPNDVLLVPRGQMVYVIGEVGQAGGFVLAEREALSVLQAIAMAQGLTSNAATKKARIIRPVVGSNRIEIAVNLKDILAGKKEDILMLPEDILFVPNSYAKGALRSTLDTIIRTATSASIYRRY